MPGIHLIGSRQAKLGRVLLSAGMLTGIWVLRRIVRQGLKLVLHGEGERATTAGFGGHQISDAGSAVAGVFTLARTRFENLARRRLLRRR